MTSASLETPLILRVGARCPLGLTSLETAMGVRAGKLEPRSSALLDKRGRPVGACRARWLPDDLFGFDRLVALGAPALAEAARGLPVAVPLLLTLPAAGRPDDDGRYGTDLLPALAEASGAPVDVARSALVRAGNAGFAAALASAAEMLASGAPLVLVGGVDSHFHPGVIQGLDEECRLHAEGIDDGILPSEGAAFVLLGTAAALARVPGAAAIAALTCVVTGIEASVQADEPNLAAALTEALRQAFAVAAQRAPVAWVLSDVNGESDRVREWSTLEVRLRDALQEARHDRLVGELGDVGAATGALLLAVACTYFAVGCAPARSAVVSLSSDGPERGVFVAEAAS